MKLQNVKGSFDYQPKEQKIRNYIEKTLKEVFENYAYQPLETPILCYYDLLSLKYEENDEILKEIYKLSDQGNRRLGLRYDLTVPFAKFIAINKSITMPFKRYEIGKAFRDGPVKVGRNREFIQCDVDAVGISGGMIEVEQISLFVTACNKLKIDIEVRYNNRKIMSGLIIESDIDKENISNIITIIDKLNKLPIEDIKQELCNLNITKKSTNTLLEYFNLTSNELKEKFKNTSNQILLEGITELNDLDQYIDTLKLNKYVKFTPSLARGQEYYTGTVFEVYAKDNSITSSIGGGGRYDKMITNFIDDGNIYPAVGISFGLNVIYEIIKDRKEFTDKSLIDIYIIPMNTNKECLTLANNLREYRYKIDIEMNNRKIKKCFEYANREKIPYVIIIGDDEIKNNIFKLKDMASGNEYNVNFNDLKSIKKIVVKQID